VSEPAGPAVLALRDPDVRHLAAVLKEAEERVAVHLPGEVLHKDGRAAALLLLRGRGLGCRGRLAVALLGGLEKSE
jgi:hypothetical protein